MANAVRIVLALAIPASETVSEVLTPDRLHRVEGIVVYLVFLFLLHAAAELTWEWLDLVL